MIGFMQGRLVAPVGNKVQAFPDAEWKHELEIAEQLGFKLMEWTVNQTGLTDNPINVPWYTLKDLVGKNITVKTIDCEFIVEKPFFKLEGQKRKNQIDNVHNIANAGLILNIPLLDNSGLDNRYQLNSLIDGLSDIDESLLLFETDMNVSETWNLLTEFPNAGLTYDTGNSAAYGYNPLEEIRSYGSKIRNVHIKDRLLQGPSVPLGTGSVDFPAVFAALREIDYCGDFILQPARSPSGDHVGVIVEGREFIERQWRRP